MKVFKLFFIISSLFTNAFAFQIDKSTCTSKEIEVEAYYYFDGDYETLTKQVDTPVSAYIKYKLKNSQSLKKLFLNGVANYSAKGPYFELNDSKGNSFFISAIASDSESELKIDGHSYSLYCN
ncbi:MAG: hypothetical protein KDD45_03510 [Bdellovibrionales bacterium]|nr:hypothetical protein [Bdellovibrionales bacterium]